MASSGWLAVALTPGRWHLLLVSLRRAPPMRGRHEATVFVDGRRVQTTPCAYPGSLQDKESREPQGSNPFDSTTFQIGALE